MTISPTLHSDALVLCSCEATLSWLHPTISSQGLSVHFCHSKEDVKYALGQHQYRLLIWHRADMEMDMHDFCREARDHSKQAILLVIAEKHIEADHIACLELGASDYMGESYSPAELKARLRAHLFRTQSLIQQFEKEKGEKQILCRGLSINTEQRRVHFMGEEVVLTAKEFGILTTLASRPGQVFTRDQLLDTVWGQDSANYAHTVSTHINRLRGKLEAINSQTILIHTLWGIGYKFCDCSDAHTPS